RFSARDVAEWRAKIATTEDPWGQRTSLPNVSSSAVSRAFPFPESRNTLSGAHQRPLPPEPLVPQPLRPSQEPRSGPAITAAGEPQPEEEKGVADITWGADAVQAPIHALPDHGQAVAAPQLIAPAAAVTAPRRNLAARLALVVLFMIAAGLAVYQFVL